ncbi:alpha/beta fold hydrolase [Pseudoroseomonas wenyumeiae]
MLFADFALEERVVEGQALRLRRGGDGPPLLLLHGNPQTHMMWHRVAPVLARRFTVICPDLRGYGFSGKPGVTPDHAPYAKRAMAADMLGLMRQLGFPASAWSATTAAPAWRTGWRWMRRRRWSGWR